MKKLLSVLIAAVMSVTMLFAAAGAQAENDIRVLLDGKEIEFDVPPQIFEDFTFVPMRAIFEALGADVAWDGTTQTITSQKDGTEIIMNIGYKLMFVNYSPITLEAPPRIIDGRTLVPVRAVAESFDCDVEWDDETRTVIITTEDKEPIAEFPIVYDDSVEKTSSQAKGFKLTSVTKNDDGKYEITYKVDTYRESSGDVIVTFECLDGDGKKVDGFSQLFFAFAYCWTPQTGSAVISDKTATIKLADNQ